MSSAKKTSKTATVETLLLDLEALVSEMESGQLSLEASVDAYRKGTELAAQCQQKLSQIREQIAILDQQTQTLIDTSPDALS